MGNESLSRHTVIIGGGACSMDALGMLLDHLRPESPLRLAVLLEDSCESAEDLPAQLRRLTPSPVTAATTGALWTPGRLFWVPPTGSVRITCDSLFEIEDAINGPALDGLFTSAAATYGESLVAVLLGGTGSSEAAGLAAAAAAGAVTVVQHPATAATPEKPSAALRTVRPEHVLNPKDMALMFETLERLLINAGLDGTAHGSPVTLEGTR